MQYRMLGRTGLKVSLLSYGTGGPSKLGENTGLTAAEQDALVRRCLDTGINLFDTSPAYGGSEATLGRALRGIPRDSYILATKWGHHKEGRLKEDPQELIDSVNRSLARMNTDYVDVLQFHGVTPAQYEGVVERFYPTMEHLREQGKIRFIGLTETLVQDPKHEIVVLALSAHPELWDTVMLKYGIMNQWAAREALPLALKHNTGILNMAPVRLTLTRSNELQAALAEWREQGVVPDGALPATDPLGWLVHDGVDSVISAGYKFAASHPAISTVITGTSSIEHLEKNAAAVEHPELPPADYQRLVDLFGESAAPR